MRRRQKALIKITTNPVIEFPNEKRWPPKLTDILVILLAALTLWVAHHEGSTSELQNREIDSIGTEIGKMNKQITYMSKIVINQDSQLTELRSTNQKLQKQGNDIFQQTYAISLQLKIGQQQQAEQLKLAFLTKKMYITRLMNTITHIKHLYPNFDLEDIYMNNKEQLNYLKSIKELVEKELNNYAILENDSLSSCWLRSYNLLESAVQLLQFSDRTKVLSDPSNRTIPPEEIKHRRFTSTYFEWGKSLGVIVRIIKKEYKEYLPKESD